MKKNGYKGRYRKILSCAVAVLLFFLQPCSVLAAEMPQTGELSSQAETDQSETDLIDSVKYIVEFEALAEEDAYFPCMYKPMLGELEGSMDIQAEGQLYRWPQVKGYYIHQKNLFRLMIKETEEAKDELSDLSDSEA